MESKCRAFDVHMDGFDEMILYAKNELEENNEEENAKVIVTLSDEPCTLCGGVKTRIGSTHLTDLSIVTTFALAHGIKDSDVTEFVQTLPIWRSIDCPTDRVPFLYIHFGTDLQIRTSGYYAPF